MVQRQMPFATSFALNTTAKTLVARNKRDTRRTFSIPVNYTLNAFRFDFVKIRDTEAGIAKATNRRKNQKPTNRSHYLEIQEEGGPRPQTGMEIAFEQRLPYTGILRHITPTSKCPKDKRGVTKKGERNRIISTLEA